MRSFSTLILFVAILCIFWQIAIGQNAIEMCLATMHSTCTYESGTFPNSGGLTPQNGRKKRQIQDVNCFADGTCVLRVWYI
jgi:hypothetical protein